MDEQDRDYRTLEEEMELCLGQLIGQMSAEEKISQLSHESPAIERLGIPEYNWWNECLHGVARSGKATVFPQVILMAATFDRELVRKVATAISDEARAKHHRAISSGNRGQYVGLTFWSPNINLFRDPRWGRGQETFGEDPFLTGVLAREYVAGLQGEDRFHLKVAACAKHFVVHSGPERTRHGFDARCSLKDFHESYLPAFRILVEAGVEAVMGAYNRTNGEPCCASSHLIDELLRGDMGFQGHFVSDCWALQDLHNHHGVTDTPEESIALALKAGCDLNCGCLYQDIGQALEKGLVEVGDIERSLRRLLRTRYRLGLLPCAPTSPYETIPQEVIASKENRALALEAAEKGCVLLKNMSETLPLTMKAGRILVVGPNATSVDMLLGTYAGCSGNMVTILEGIVERAPVGIAVEYRPGCQLVHANENPQDWVFFEAGKCELVIAVMGLSPLVEGEEGDAGMSADCGDRGDSGLPAVQMEFLEKIRKRARKLVVVLASGSPVTSPRLHEMADALVWTGYPGEAGGTAVANILFGAVNPSGKLPFTVPCSVDDLPPFDDYSMRGRTYRYAQQAALYPFGFGLSYTAFDYRNMAANSTRLDARGTLLVKVDVANTGSRPGTETVQLYQSSPEAPGEHPSYSLIAFQRVELKPGESKQLQFTLDADLFHLFDDQGDRRWYVGRVVLYAGGCSPMKTVEELGLGPPATLNISLI